MIDYPARIAEKLGQDKMLRSVVDGATSRLGSWLAASRMPFFPDYSDHGPVHVEETLNTAAALVPEKSWEVVSSADAAVLTLATLYHDMAMHLTEDGFRQLVRGGAATWRVAEFDEHLWPAAWERFIGEASHWSDIEAARILGIHPADWPSSLHDPLASERALSQLDVRLTGEFIRRNHGRLAHEMALHGIPGPNPVSDDPLQNLERDLCDLCGLVARSHGLPIRGCLDYVAQRYHKREYRFVHTVYLMVLLRLSDYLQIDRSRAPLIVFQYRRLAGARAETEWRAHNAVKSVSLQEDDPEALSIIMEPPDVCTFLRLQDWTVGLQRELDACWAVLGEVYGRFDALRDLGVVIRRVRTNMEDPVELARKVDFVPRKVEFGIAKPATLKLLVKPLYGDDISVGIRELVQNAVDAVRERDYYEKKHPDPKRAARQVDHPDVEVAAEEPTAEGGSWLSVADQGIGMTEDTVCRYFLTAGASIRYDEAWRTEFEATDEDGQPPGAPRTSVLRAGRFGIGVLAAFLLGDRIEVATRHISAIRGLRLATSLDEDPMELKYDPTLPIGTTIRVRLARSAVKKLNQVGDPAPGESPTITDWYCFDYPKVALRVGVRPTGGTSTPKLKFDELGTSPQWRKVHEMPGLEVFWSYSRRASLSVNGLMIHRKHGWSIGRWWANRERHPGFYVEHPTSICVIDPDGLIPLTLRRDDLTAEGHSKLQVVYDSVFRDYMAYLMISTPAQPSLAECIALQAHPGVRAGWAGSNYLFTRIGVCPATAWAAKESKLSNLAVIIDPDFDVRILDDFRHDAYAYRPLHQSQLKISGLLRFIVDTFRGGRTWRGRLLNGFRVIGARVLCSHELADGLTTGGGRYAPGLVYWGQVQPVRFRQMRAEFSVEEPLGVWSMVASKDCPPTLLDVDRFMSRCQIADTESGILLMEYFLEGRTSATPVPPTWAQVMRSPIIPYDIERRRTLLAHAYKELEPYIEDALKRAAASGTAP
jgi:molecular chaperone HtpG